MSCSGYAQVLLGVFFEVEEQEVPIQLIRYDPKLGTPWTAQDKGYRLWLKHADWRIELPPDDQYYCDVPVNRYLSNPQQRWREDRKAARLHQFLTAVGIQEGDRTAKLTYQPARYDRSRLVVGQMLASGDSDSSSSHRGFICTPQQIADVQDWLRITLGDYSYDVRLHLIVSCG